MIKVQILDNFEFCERKANIFDCEDVDSHSETYESYRSFEMYQGSGYRTKWLEVD